MKKVTQSETNGGSTLAVSEPLSKYGVSYVAVDAIAALTVVKARYGTMIAPSDALIVRSTSDIFDGVSCEFIATFDSEPVYTTTASAKSTLRSTEPRRSRDEAESGSSDGALPAPDGSRRIAPLKVWMWREGGSNETVPTTRASSFAPSACATSAGGSRSLRLVSPSMLAVSTYATPLGAEEVRRTASAGRAWRSRTITRSPTRRSSHRTSPLAGVRARTSVPFSARSERSRRRSSTPSLSAVRTSTKTSTPAVLHDSYGVTHSCGACSPTSISAETTR
mmetsp:Transcript_1168/g.3776  ORF Transcript_1168/g.3776 Transcript_1168/m.3776 type:complete len:279 (-) Transcript_1168:238-1074(-)